MRSKSVAVFAVLALVAAGAGFAIGRSRTDEHLRSLLGEQVRRFRTPDLPDGGSQAELRAEIYEAVNRVLDRRLRAARARAAAWHRLMAASDQAERSSIAEEIRAGLQTALGPPLAEGPAQLRGDRSWFERDGVTVSLVDLDLASGRPMTCVQLMPTEGAGPHPALLVLHGIDADLSSLVVDVDYHHGLAMELARQGFVIVAPLRAATTAEARSTLYAKATALGLTEAGIEIWPLRAVIDYLAGLDAVNRERVGVYGVSQGGRDALWLSALDERISVTVVSAYFTERFPWLLQRRGGPHEPPGNDMVMRIAPEEIEHFLPAMGYGLDDLNLVAAIQPRPLLLVLGTQDPRHAGGVRAHQKARQIYAHVGHPDRIQLVEFDGGHETNVKAVLPFLERWAAGDRLGSLRLEHER